MIAGAARARRAPGRLGGGGVAAASSHSACPARPRGAERSEETQVVAMRLCRPAGRAVGLICLALPVTMHCLDRPLNLMM